jgi:hypothetical protein
MIHLLISDSSKVTKPSLSLLNEKLINSLRTLKDVHSPEKISFAIDQIKTTAKRVQEACKCGNFSSNPCYSCTYCGNLCEKCALFGKRTGACLNCGQPLHVELGDSNIICNSCLGTQSLKQSAICPLCRSFLCYNCIYRDCQVHYCSVCQAPWGDRENYYAGTYFEDLRTSQY